MNHTTIITTTRAARVSERVALCWVALRGFVSTYQLVDAADCRSCKRWRN